MIPRLHFANLPTPVEPMPRLSAALGGPHLWVKRDDLTGPAFGGNKTRKLEFVFAEAQGNGAKTLITVGGIQSNHCRQTAALAAKFGLKCKLVLNGDPPDLYSGNLLVDWLCGAEVTWCKRSERDAVLKKTFEESWSAGERPYLIPLGASNATGSLGYVYAMQELVAQNHIVKPDWIIVPSSSAGTAAGMILGAWQTGFQGKILSISIDEPQAALQEHIADLASEASERFGPRINFDPQTVLVNSDYLGAGYGIMGKPEAEAIHLFGRLEGQILCPVYTARAGAGMIDLIRKGFFKREETVLFWHTGGSPTIFAEPYAVQIQKDFQPLV